MFEDLFAGGLSLADYKPEGDGGEMSKEQIEALKAWWQQMLSSPQMQQYQRMGGGGYPLDNLWQRGGGQISRSPTEGFQSLDDINPGLADKISKALMAITPMAMGPAKLLGKTAMKAGWENNVSDRLNRQAMEPIDMNRGFLGFTAGTVPGTTPGSGIVGHDPSFGWGGQTAADMGFGSANPVGLSDVGSLGMLGDMQGFGGSPDVTVDIGLMGPAGYGGGFDGADTGLGGFGDLDGLGDDGGDF